MSIVRFCRAYALLVLSAGFAMQAWALPSLPSVVSGSASFIGSSNTLDITSSPNAIMNWDDFSIGAGETVRFIQPGDSSAVLLRSGIVPSTILGTLSSNGKLFLTNPQGFSFGNGSLLDAAGFWISDSGLTDADFLAGNFNVQPTGNTGNILVDGTIRVAPGGSVSLMSGGEININAGSIIDVAGGNISLGGATLTSIDYSQIAATLIDYSQLTATLIDGTLTGGNATLDPTGGTLGYIDPTGGTLGYIPPYGGTLNGILILDGNIPAVPEPDIMVLMIIGIGVLGAVVRRRAVVLPEKSGR